LKNEGGKGADIDIDIDDYEAVTDKLVEVFNGGDVQNAFKAMDGVVQQFWAKKDA